MRARRRRAVAGILAVVMLTATGCEDDARTSVDASTPMRSTEPSATASVPSSIPAGDGPIEPGTYRIPRSAWSVADFSVTFPEGWTVQYGHVYTSNKDEGDEFGFYAVVVDAIYADPCVGSDTGELIEFGPDVEDLATALLQHPGLTASGPVATTLGGSPATRIDLTVPEGFDLAACNVKNIGLQIWYSPPADKYFVLLADGVASVYILDVNGERQVFLTQHGSTTSEQDLAELQAVLDSIRIEA